MKQWVNAKLANVKDYYIRPRRIALIYALSAFIALLALWSYVGDLAKERLLQDEQIQVTNRIHTIGTSLALAVNQRLLVITSVHSYLDAKISQHNNSGLDTIADFNDFDGFASGLYQSTDGIHNIAIAPNSVMQFVYPYEENKAVLGYNPTLDERPFVREEVERAINTGEIVLSLPYELIQGGQGLIARQAVYVDGRYWGLVNVVLDVPPLFEESKIDPMPAGLDLAILDQSGKVFYGSASVLVLEPIMYEIILPEGKWILAAVPNKGWGMGNQTLMWFFHSLVFVSMITIPLVIYLFVNRKERLAYQVEQRTKELAQSNLTLINVLEGINADVYVADFDTHEILFANKHLEESFKDELVGKICYEVFRHEKSVCALCKNSKLLQSDGEPSGVLLWEDHNPITKRWYSNADRAIRWHDGRYVHLQIATDISEQKKALKVISDSEERYRQAVENSPNPIFSISFEGMIQTWNQASEKTFQFDKRIIGQHYHTLLQNVEEGSYVDTLLGQVQYGQSLSDVNLVYRRQDGEKRLTVSRIYPLCNHREEVQGYVFDNTDVTEQKRADDELKRLIQEKDILLAEVHHRVKNNMQVIISLLGLQASEIEDEQLRVVYEESRNRIKSMALVHEQLYHSNEYAHIDLGTYIDQLATTLFNTYQIETERIQLCITAENVYIDLERAIPCGLLLNELITNSLKYAFPQNQKGHIRIELQPKEDWMTLLYFDDGIGLPANLDIDHIQSLGLQLVHLLAIHDLHGNLKLGNEQRKGTQFLIDFPLNGNF